jgi:hypothetical protein
MVTVRPGRPRRPQPAPTSPGAPHSKASVLVYGPELVLSLLMRLDYKSRHEGAEIEPHAGRVLTALRLHRPARFLNAEGACGRCQPAGSGDFSIPSRIPMPLLVVGDLAPAMRRGLILCKSEASRASDLLGDLIPLPCTTSQEWRPRPRLSAERRERVRVQASAPRARMTIPPRCLTDAVVRPTKPWA